VSAPAQAGGSLQHSSTQPVFGQVPFAASGERINTRSETLNIALALLFFWRD